MNREEFYVPTADDVDALRLENELLAFENSYVKSLLAEAERESDRLRVAEEQIAVYRVAYHDLRWLLRRLSSSPLGPILRRWSGWRELINRHMHEQ